MTKYAKNPTHYIGKRQAEGTHKRPEYTAVGKGIFERDRAWPTTDKFLEHLRATAPRFENVDRATARRVRHGR